MSNLTKQINIGDQQVVTVSICGTELWYKNGVLHREGAPAIVSTTGNWMWFHKGQPHRIDGPALKDGDLYEYWVYGERVSSEHYDMVPGVPFEDGPINFVPLTLQSH